jgi:hypothetical protein
VEAFAGDDYGVEGNDTDSDAGLEFLGESNFSFVFQIGGGKSGKNSGATHWARARRQQERKVAAAGLTNLSVVEDDVETTTARRWTQFRMNQAKNKNENLHAINPFFENGSDPDDEDDEMARLSSFDDGAPTVTNPVAFALAAGVLHQARVRGLTASDVMAASTLTSAMGAAMAARGGSE